MAIKYDKLLGKIREKDAGIIPQLDADPVSPTAEAAWVLKTGGAVGGGEIKAFLGLGFPFLTTGVGSATYQLSYQTKEGTIKRVSLT